MWFRQPLGTVYERDPGPSTGALRELLAALAPESLPANVIRVPVNPLPLKVRCFLDWIAPRLRAQMAY